MYQRHGLPFLQHTDNRMTHKGLAPIKEHYTLWSYAPSIHLDSLQAQNRGTSGLCSSILFSLSPVTSTHSLSTSPSPWTLHRKPWTIWCCCMYLDQCHKYIYIYTPTIIKPYVKVQNMKCFQEVKKAFRPMVKPFSISVCPTVVVLLI